MYLKTNAVCVVDEFDAVQLVCYIVRLAFK